MKQSIASILALGVVFAGCDGVTITGSDNTSGGMYESDYSTANDLYVDECAVVYTTNKFRAVTDWSDGSISDDGGTIASGDVNVTIRNGRNSVISDEILSLPRVNYGDVIETSVTFPSYTSIFDTINAGFDLYFTNLRVNYSSLSSTYHTSADDGLVRSCYYYYFITLHNKLYTGSRDVLGRVAARSASSSSNISSLIEEKQLTDDKGHKVTAAVAKFDLLADFAASKGIASTDRSVILKQMKSRALFKDFAKYRQQIRSSADNTKIALARVSVESLGGIALERLKSKLGTGAPSKLVETVDAMVNYSMNLK